MRFPWLAKLSRSHFATPASRRVSPRRVPGERPQLVSLEDRTLLSTAITWTGLGDHSSWTDVNNWDLHRVPAAGDDVTITNANGTTAVTYDGSLGTVSVDSLTTGVNFNLMGGALETTGGGSVTTGGVTLQNNVNFTIDGGAQLVAAGGSQSITGTGTVLFGANVNNAIAFDGDVTLTIDDNIEVGGQNGIIGQIFNTGGTQTLVNNGFIFPRVAGGTLTLDPDSGGSGGSIVNNGGIEAYANTLVLDNNIDNTNGDITIGGGPSTRVLQNGITIKGGEIGGVRGVLVPSHSTANILDGVTIGAVGVTLAGPAGEEGVIDNLEIDEGTLTIDQGTVLYFIGSPTLPAATQQLNGDLGVINFGASAGNALSLEGNIDLEMGRANQITIQGQNATIGSTFGTPGTQTITNLGTIGPSVAGGLFTIDVGGGSGTFDNSQGELQTLDPASTLAVNCQFADFDGVSTLHGGIYRLFGTLEFPAANLVTNDASLFIENSAAQIVDSDTGVNVLPNLATNTAKARLWVRFGTQFTTAGDFTNLGQVLVDANPTPTSFVPGGSYIQSGASALTMLQSNAVLGAGSGTVDIEGGSLTVRGSNEIDGNVTNAAAFGTAAAGLTGKLTIEGNYTQTAAGTLYIDLKSTGVAGTAYDALAVSGTVALGGTIDVIPKGSFVPQLGNSFQILTFGPTASPGDFVVKMGYFLSPNRVFTEQFSPATNPTSLTLVVTTANLQFLTQPTDTVAGKPIDGSGGVQVAVVDANGVVVTADSTDQIALAANQGTLGGGKAVTVSNGVATFANLTITRAGTGYQLTASSSGYGSVASAGTFAITPDVLAKLVFTREPPASARVGDVLSTVRVTEEDKYDNTETGDGTSQIALSLAPNPGALGGTTTQTVQAGVVTFGDLVVSQVGTGYKLTARTGNVSQSSSAFNITALNTTTVAANAAGSVGQAVTLQATVRAVGSSFPVNEGTVVFEVFNGTTQIGSTTPAANVSNGQASASFAIPSTLPPGSYTVEAFYTPGPEFTASQSDPGNDGTLTVTNSKATQTVVTSPAPIVRSTTTDQFVPLTATVTNNGAPVTSGYVVFSVAGIPGNSGQISLNASGVASTMFKVPAGTAASKNGYPITATFYPTHQSGLQGSSGKGALVVLPYGNPDHLAFLKQPQTTAVGKTLPSVQVEVLDSNGNVVQNDSTDVITLVLQVNPGNATLTGGGAITVTNGIASFSHLSIDVAANGYVLRASDTAGPITGQFVDSTPFNITATGAAVADAFWQAFGKATDDNLLGNTW